MKSLIPLLLIFSFQFCNGQTNINEIINKSIRNRVLFIKFKTDSFLNKAANKVVFNKLVPDFEVTYQVGELYKNYLFLNEYEQDPSNIYKLIQYYSIKDTTLGVSDTIGIFYLELINQFAHEPNILEVRFKSNEDYIKVKALNYLYQPATLAKLKELIKSKKLKTPFIKIAVVGNSNNYFILVKDKYKPHNYPL